MSQNSHIYELSINNLCVYRNNDLNYVFHEYLNYYLSDSKLNLVIKKKLYDETKRFPLYLESIKFNHNIRKFVSDNEQTYDILDIPFLRQLFNDNDSRIRVQTSPEKKPEQAKIPINRPAMPKVKVVSFDKKEGEENKDEKVEKVEKDDHEEIDEEKLKELEEMIGKLEELKEQEVERMEKEKEIIANKEMEDRQLKMKERTMKDKRKEINNIFEADRRLYFNFSEISKELERLKKGENNNDERRISELTQSERRARVLFLNNEDFKIPELFVHKYPIFEFMDRQNIINHEHALLVFKQIYYKNYELSTESRSYFGEEVYMFNNEDEENYEKHFTEEQRELIENFSDDISQKLIDIEKIISKKIDQNRDIFKQKDFSRMHEIDDISENEDSDSESDKENLTA